MVTHQTEFISIKWPDIVGSGRSASLAFRLSPCMNVLRLAIYENIGRTSSACKELQYQKPNHILGFILSARELIHILNCPFNTNNREKNMFVLIKNKH
jgi:hypothetical protein